MRDVITHFRNQITGLPASDEPGIQQARQRAEEALDTLTTALNTDPTLTERHIRDIDLIGELLRQIKPLARQAELELRRQQMEAESTPADVIARRLGRTNPNAPTELDALSNRLPELAAQVRAAAWPDWRSADRVRELSELRLPHPETVEYIADQLRNAVRSSLELEHPAAEAVRLAALADQICLHDDTSQFVPEGGLLVQASDAVHAARLAYERCRAADPAAQTTDIARNAWAQAMTDWIDARAAVEQARDEVAALAQLTPEETAALGGEAR